MKLYGRGLLPSSLTCGYAVLLFLAIATPAAQSQTAPNLPVLKGLATVTTLSQTEAGRLALRANYDVTAAIQTGRTPLPSALTFPEQQQLALRDAAITFHTLAQLADGLGSTLGAAYVARVHEDAAGHAAQLSPATGRLIAWALSVSGNDSNAGKFLFSNATTDGHTPAPAALRAILTDVHGETDPFGRAYHLVAGATGADPFGDSRPFQTEHDLLSITGRDYFNQPSTSESYQRGPAMDLTASPSYPSGHTTYGYTGAILLGVLVPDRYPEMIARGAEYGSNRIIVGAHYAMDVLGGRTTALYDMAHLFADDPAYMTQTPGGTAHGRDFRAAVTQVRREVSAVLRANCGDAVQVCALTDIGRFNDAATNRAQVAATMTYSLPVVFAATAHISEDVSRIAPEAGYLLTVAYPALTLKEADDLLTATEGPGGGFLDDGTAFGLYSRLNLYEAAVRARDLSLRRRPALR